MSVKHQQQLQQQQYNQLSPGFRISTLPSQGKPRSSAIRSAHGSPRTSKNDLYGQSSGSTWNGTFGGHAHSVHKPRGSSASSSLRSKNNSGSSSSSGRRKRTVTLPGERIEDSHVNNTVIEVLLSKQLRMISGVEFDLEIQLTHDSMVILAEQINGDDMKIIEIPRNRALSFFEGECAGQIDNLIDRLHLDNNQLFLVSKATNPITDTTTTTANAPAIEREEQIDNQPIDHHNMIEKGAQNSENRPQQQ